MIETGLTREGGVTFMRHPGGNILLGHKQAPGVGAVETQLAFA